MAKNNSSCEMHSKDEKTKMQDREINERLGHIQNKILVMSGKGGVGKSSVAAYMAVVMARKGYKTGLMDVDLHGPSIPRLLGVKGGILPGSQEGKALPVECLPNLSVISIEVLMGENKDTATIWRGPLKIGVIRQFISDIEWGDLDYLIIDSPPGTGDEPLTVAQTISDASALIVTTPQEISLADVRKSINFCRQVNMNILGLVENMSGLICPHCGKEIDLFKSKGGMITAQKENLRLLGTIPLEPEVVSQGDRGDIRFMEDDQLAYTKALNELVDEIVNLRSPSEDSASPDLGLGKKAVSTEKGLAKSDGKTLAIPLSGGKLSNHFGHSEEFALIGTEKGEVKEIKKLTPPPHEPGVLPRWLHEQGADVIIAGGIGQRAKQILAEKGIEVVVGAPVESPEILAGQYLSGTLRTGENVCDH